MKFFSFKNLFGLVYKTFIRFPFVILSAKLGAFIAIYMADLDNIQLSGQEYLYRIIITATLGISLFLLFQLFSERKKIGKATSLIIKIAGAGLLILYCLLLPRELESVDVIRFLSINLALHCFVSFAPFIVKGEMNGFWQFNKTLFIRVLITALYLMVLFAGLSLAMLASDELFGLEIKEERYFQLFLVLVGIIGTYIFLAGVPENHEELDRETQYPLGLKIFAQYILLPLIGLYFVILYIYSAKIIFMWEWPVGWVSNLILAFSVAGIFSFLLLYPIKNSDKYKWVNLFTKLFYWSVIPLIIILFLAIWRRISEYGITENRYFVIVLALWLAGITLFQIINRFRNIKIIPLSLGIIALLSVLGPWNAFNISKISQYNRLEKKLTEYNILKGGKVEKITATIPFNDMQQISSMVEYLESNFGYQVLQPFYAENLDSILVDSMYYNNSVILVEMMGLNFINRWEQEEYYMEHFYYATAYNMENVIKISGFDYMLNCNQYFYGYDNDSVYSQSFLLDTNEFIVEFDTISNDYRMIFDRTDTVSLDIVGLVKQIKETEKYGQSYDMLNEKMKMNKSGQYFEVIVNFRQLYGEFEDEMPVFSEINATIFVKIKSLEKKEELFPELLNDFKHGKSIYVIENVPDFNLVSDD